MSHVILVEQVFASRAKAESYFDELRPVAWPYVWCIQDIEHHRWCVTALVEEPGGKEIAAGP